MISSASGRSLRSSLTSNERDYLFLQSRAKRRKKQFRVRAMVATAGMTLLLFVFSLSVEPSPLIAVTSLISTIVLLGIAYHARDTVPEPVSRNASFDLIELVGRYQCFEVGTGDTPRYVYTIAGATVTLPPHWIRYLEVEEPLHARVARSEHDTLYVLSLRKGPAVDTEMSMGLASLPSLYPVWKIAAVVGSLLALIALPIVASLGEIQWMLLWGMSGLLFLALGGWFLLKRWRFLRRIDEHYHTQYGLTALSWWDRRSEYRNSFLDERTAVMDKDARRGTVRPLNEG